MKSMTSKFLGFLLLSFVTLSAHEHGGEDHQTKPTVTVPVSSPVQTGQGDWVYTTVPGWGKISGKDYIGSTHGGIVVDQSGKIYVSTNGDKTLAVFEPDGKFIRSFGPAFRGIHGMNINTENGQQFIYAAAIKKVYKISLEGDIVLTLKGDQWQNATAVAVAPNGDIFVADGYGSSVIFKYDKNGQFIKRIGARGKDNGKFKTSHGLAVDNRNPDQPYLVIADRENKRIQLFDLDGNFVKVAITGLRRPCSLSIWGEHMAVAELQGRVVILDKDYKIVSKIGDNPNKQQWAKFRIKPQDWQGGIFTAPHGVSFDDKGNLYVMDWNQWGRVTKLTKNK